jgi:hypothetical protein
MFNRYEYFYCIMRNDTTIPMPIYSAGNTAKEKASGVVTSEGSTI